MFNIESFCAEPWSQIEITTLGDYKICCLSNYDEDYGLAYDSNGQVMNVLTHSITEAINSVTHKEHRKELRKNIKVKRCRSCYDGEQCNPGTDQSYNILTKRQRVNFVTAREIPEYVNCNTADQYTLNDGTSTAKIVNLAMRFGNLCNQKCIMCSPEYSSLWYDDWVSLYGYNQSVLPNISKNKTFKIEVDNRGKNTLNFVKWWESEIWWQRFNDIAADLKHIYISGGEPLIAPATDKMLDILIEQGYAKNITVRFDTNLSVINNKIIDRFKQFKKVNLCISVDDVEDRYELIRFPGNYKTLLKNIRALKDSGVEIHCLYCSIGMLSIYCVPRIIKLSEELGIRPIFRFIEGPFWLDLRSMPVSAKQEIIYKYKEFDTSTPDRKKWCDSVIAFLEKYIDYENLDRTTEFVSTMNKLDDLRETNWKLILPDVYDLIQRHCPRGDTVS